MPFGERKQDGAERRWRRRRALARAVDTRGGGEPKRLCSELAKNGRRARLRQREKDRVSQRHCRPRTRDNGPEPDRARRAPRERLRAAAGSSVGGISAAAPGVREQPGRGEQRGVRAAEEVGLAV